jgi:hypothetical protein
MDANFLNLNADKQERSEKDASGGYAGLGANFKINFLNALGTIVSFLTNANTAVRTYTFPDVSGTVALTSDLTGLVFTTGDVKVGIKTVADAGWVMLNDGTLGDNSSSATYMPSNTTLDPYPLYALLWANCTTTCAVSSGGRGANPAADYAAHKTIALPKALGRALAIAGAGASLTARALGLSLGEEAHVQALTEMATHTHAGSGSTSGQSADHTHAGAQINVGLSSIWVGGSGFVSAYGACYAVYANPSNTGYTSNDHTHTVSITTTGQGSSQPANIMQPTTFFNAMIKL